VAGAGAPSRYVRSAALPSTAPVVEAEPAREKVVAKAKPDDAKPDAPAEISPREYQRMLLNAALNGDIPAATEALCHGADIDRGLERESSGKTPLQVSMVDDKKNMFMFLIQHGANVEKTDADGNTPLMFVAEHKLNFDYGEALVSPGAADPVEVNKNTGKSAAQIARANGYVQLAKYLESERALEEYEAARKDAEKRAKDNKSSHYGLDCGKGKGAK